jgi:hypothetical protein
MPERPAWREPLELMSDAATFDCMCFGGSIVAMVEPNKHAITATATEDFMLMSKLIAE